jgi:hypothetical protein
MYREAIDNPAWSRCRARGFVSTQSPHRRLGPVDIVPCSGALIRSPSTDRANYSGTIGWPLALALYVAARVSLI